MIGMSASPTAVGAHRLSAWDATLPGRSPMSLCEAQTARLMAIPGKATEAKPCHTSVSPAAFNEEAAAANIGVRKSDLLPRLNFEALYQVSRDATSTSGRTETGIIQGTLSVPLYQSGSVYSRIREAKHTASQRKLEVLDAYRQVREQVVSAWHLLKAATATIAAANDAVAANRVALDGVRQEAQVGTRTTLDVLDAQNELVNAQVALANARRDRIVAGYQLVAAIGRMTAADLRLSVPIYDPRENLEDVRDKAFGARVNTYE